MNFQNLTLERITRDARNVNFGPNDSYLLSYPEFISYFRNTDPIEEHHFIISSHFVYGWMPKILKLDRNKIKEAVSILNKARKADLLDKDEIEHLKSCVNNSLVGVSKLLHFIRPEAYPIWDSNTFTYATGQKPHHYRMEKTDSYLAYRERLFEITEMSGFSEVQSVVEGKFTPMYKYTMTRLRVIELVMFSSRNKENQ